MTKKHDNLFNTLASNIESFCFDEQVTAVFADMIRRSVPGYASVIAMTGVLGAEHVKPNTRVYDLGCSLGTSLISIYDRVESPCELIGIDNAPAMIKACEQNLATRPNKPQIKISLRCEDVSDVEIKNASLVVMNYTLQFIAPEKRLTLLSNIFNGLNAGGVLLLSEKVHFKGKTTEDALTKLYYDFKKHNGYSALEISQKRQALENVLITETEQDHIERLNLAGFSHAMSWFQCINFRSFIAFKSA